MRPDIDDERTTRSRAGSPRAAQIKRRRLVFLACLLVVIVIIVALAARSCGGAEDSPDPSTESTATGLVSATYTAELTGADSVPAVDTRANAELTLEYDADNDEMAFTLALTYKISSPTVATICQGLPGEYGTTVYTLFAGPAKQGDFEGVLAEGTIDEADFVGPLKGDALADLIALIEDGEAYVSIGNERHPVDAIRGQIR